jgi:hypothetical protein
VLSLPNIFLVISDDWIFSKSLIPLEELLLFISSLMLDESPALVVFGLKYLGWKENTLWEDGKICSYSSGEVFRRLNFFSTVFNGDKVLFLKSCSVEDGTV